MGKSFILTSSQALPKEITVVRLEASIESFQKYIQSKKHWKQMEIPLQEITPTSTAEPIVTIHANPQL